ncbi:MAG: imidazole glycerol phosphate synthase subunit HisH [Methanosarcina sp.]|nr:imidazole glycerol phosphate synthase subunit HisH [Methanosarcina sp.]
MIAIINYGISNLGSVSRALTRLGAAYEIVEEADQLYDASHLILPGVGSFKDGMNSLRVRGWVDAIRDAVLKDKIPVLGICLGMQLLASQGTECGDAEGLGLIPGKVVHLRSIGCEQRVPHAGWNNISFINKECPLFSGVPEDADFYFVHSYTFQPKLEEHIAAITNYSVPIVAVVGSDIIWGTQFHPEKSSKTGMRLLKNFLGVMGC